MLIKWTTTTEQGVKGVGGKSKRNYRTSHNIRIINVFIESLCCSHTSGKQIHSEGQYR